MVLPPTPCSSSSPQGPQVQGQSRPALGPAHLADVTPQDTYLGTPGKTNGPVTAAPEGCPPPPQLGVPISAPTSPPNPGAGEKSSLPHGSPMFPCVPTLRGQSCHLCSTSPWWHTPGVPMPRVLFSTWVLSLLHLVAQEERSTPRKDGGSHFSVPSPAPGSATAATTAFQPQHGDLRAALQRVRALQASQLAPFLDNFSPLVLVPALF